MTRRLKIIAGFRLPTRRTGFTLLEMLLVVAVVAVIAAITFPALLRYVRDHDLKSQVDMVRAELDGCRLKAIETGLVYQFRYEPAGHRFLVLPAERPDIGRDGSTAATEDFLVGQTPNSVPVSQNVLSPQLQFSSPAASTMGGASSSPTSVPLEKLRPEFVALLPNSQGLNDIAWGPAVVFFPDGSSSGGTVTVQDGRSQSMSLVVRPLTSAVTVNRVEQAEKL